MRGLSGTAKAAAWRNNTPLPSRFRGPLVGEHGELFTLAQPGSLIKRSNRPQRASKRPIREPLSTPLKIPFVPLAADGAA